MKDRRGSGGAGGGDRFAVFPFSIGCMSQSSVAVADPQEKKPPQTDAAAHASSSSTTTAQSLEEEISGGGGEAMKTPAAAGIVTAGVQRLMKGIKQSLSQMFAVEDDDDEEEEEQEMVIGYPTDVQHVGHIGWDGLNKVGGGAMAMMNAFSQLPSSLSRRQLEVAMDQAARA